MVEVRCTGRQYSFLHCVGMYEQRRVPDGIVTAARWWRPAFVYVGGDRFADCRPLQTGAKKP